MNISLSQGIANRSIRCSLCDHVIEPGKVFWKGGLDETECDSLCICTGHIPLNANRMIVKPSSDESGINYIKADAVDVRNDIIPELLRDSDAIYQLTPEKFEALVFDRLIAMGLQGFRMGAANRKDGGIDIVFWTNGLLPMLGAVQVKHHRYKSSTIVRHRLK